VNRLIIIKLHQKSVYRDKNKNYRAFDAEVNESNNNDFFSEFEEKKKISDEITTMFKKTVSKIFKSE